jgi:endonuclease/exonuclease/phosphatase family metal-dependent hydrolase
MGKFSERFFKFSSIFKILSILSYFALLLSYLSPFIHPKTIAILPFIGLGYPVILIINIIWLFLWSIVRSKWAIYSLLVLLIGGKLHFRTFSFSMGGDEKQKNELKILSYNVQLFGVYKPNLEKSLATRNSIFAFLRKENPDVICLQEYYRKDKPTRFETLDSLYSIIGTKNHHERSAFKKVGKQNFGIAMFSKYPIIEKGDVIFDSQSSTDFNYCIYSDIVKNMDTFRIYNVHLQSIRLNETPYDFNKTKISDKKNYIAIRSIYRKLRVAYLKRAEQAKKIINHIKTAPYPVIICGDFNDTPMSYTYNQFNKGLVDAFRNASFGIGTSYVGRIPAGRIDYIFHSPSLFSSNFTIQKEVLSDHRAVSCIISK